MYPVFLVQKGGDHRIYAQYFQTRESINIKVSSITKI